MKKTILIPLTVYFLFLVPVSSCYGQQSQKETSYGKSANELIQLLKKNPKLKSLMEASIEKAKQINPDTVTNPVQSLDEYFAFITKAEHSVPWMLAGNRKYPSIFHNMMAAFSAFYFAMDQPLPDLDGKNIYNNSVEYTEPFASWLPTFCKSWGNYLDSDSSWNDSYYHEFLKDSVFGLQNGWYEDASHWKTFNQFLKRQLSSPAARPITSPGDNSIVVSFADAVPQGVWAIDSQSDIIGKNGVEVKTANIKSIAKLLGESQYKDSFANGIFTHSFLNVNDYHRYHFPVGGVVKEVKIIKASNPTGGLLTWDNSVKHYRFNPSVPGWQMLETRGCVILQTDSYGLVALLPIGMAFVGSVNFMENIKAGTRVNKGDMLGYFLFGGSDFIVVFQKNVQFTLDAPKAADGTYVHLLMGQKLGHLQKK